MHISVSFWTFCLYNWLSIYFLNQYYTTLIISFKMLVDNFPLNSYLFLKLLMLVSSFFQTIYRIIWLRSLEVQLRFCFKLYHHLRGKWTFQNTQTIQERNQSKHDFPKPETFDRMFPLSSHSILSTYSNLCFLHRPKIEMTNTQRFTCSQLRK